MERGELERLDRESLVLRAQSAGIKRARVLTRPELIDELLRLDGRIDESQLKRSRGFFGLARDLLSRVVERGLHLPDAAERLRAALVDPVAQVPQVPRPEPQAIPTVTLAEIYAAQGHNERAIETLRRVLEDEPDHIAARALLEKLQAADYVAPTEPLPPETEPEPVSDAASEDEPPLETPRSSEAGAVPVEAHIPDAPREDACIAIPRGRAVYVAWRLSAASERLAAESFFFVRVLVITPAWDGPRVEPRDVAADPASAELVVADLPPGAFARVAVGFFVDGDFVPVAHSPALELDRAGTLHHWRLDESEPSALDDLLVRVAAERAGAILTS